MRYLKLGALALIAAVASVTLLRLADAISAADARWLLTRGGASIAVLTAAGIALRIAAGGASRPGDGGADRPIP